MAQSVVIENNRPTYAYRAADITPAATPTDVLALGGAAGKLPAGTSLYLYFEWTEEAGA